MHSSYRLRWAATVCLILPMLVSCREPAPYRKETYSVTGQIRVNGKPAAGVAVLCRDVRGIDAEHPTITSALTDQDGRFRLSTYESGDGVPDGEYVLSFEWRDYSPFTGSYDGPDKLGGRYSTPIANSSPLLLLQESKSISE